MNVISSSCGNDSVALIQYAYENKIKNVVVVYIDTKWSSQDWPDRVGLISTWVKQLGFDFITIDSMGMESLVRMKKAFPSNQYQFCTQHLKGVPFLNWIEALDPQAKARVLIGKRRAESTTRSSIDEFVFDSEYHGGRILWHPLYRYSDKDRDELIKRAGFEVLPHRSQECSPCVNANKGDFLLLKPAQIQRVSDLEVDIGRSMFRPKRFNALGIHGVMTWAKYGKKKMRLDPAEVESGFGCDGHYGCGL